MLTFPNFSKVNPVIYLDIPNEFPLNSLNDHPRFQELVEKQKKKREKVMALVATYNFPEPEDL